MNQPNPSQSDPLQLAIDRFWETIPPTWHRVRGNLRQISTENFGITVEQFHILRHIRRGVTSVSELAEAKQISRSAISQSVDMLVEKGWITRQPDPSDRRYITLALTSSGEELLNAVFQQNRAWMRAKMAHLSPADLTMLTQALTILKTAFAEETES